MSIHLISNVDALKLLNGAQSAGVKPSLTLADLFDTQSCRLGCQLGFKSLSEHRSSSVRPTGSQESPTSSRSFSRRGRAKNAQTLMRDWFSARALSESIAGGCQCCQAFQYLFESSFDETLSTEYEYSVSLTYELKRRRHRPRRLQDGSKEPSDLQIVQLFTPQDSRGSVRNMQSSDVLCGRLQSIDRLKNWLRQCESKHACLNGSDREGARGSSEECPSRLLDLQPVYQADERGIRLIRTEASRSYRYACLSHRWDGAIKMTSTTVHNVNERLYFLEEGLLPTTIRDAITISREIGIRYLWVDSLCILQRGDNGRDMLAELKHMGPIYRHAYLTIAAISSPESSSGCLISEKWPDQCFQIDAPNAIEGQPIIIGARVLDRKGVPTSAPAVRQKYPLLHRAWVLQERLLSRRIVSCNYAEFSFECLECSHCECGNPTMAPHPPEKLKNANAWLGGLGGHSAQWFKHDLNPTVGSGPPERLWQALIEVYMQLEVTEPRDILPAISACASALERFRPQQTWKFGMWQPTTTIDLLWFIQAKEGKTITKSRPEHRNIPSWSWASVAMAQRLRHVDEGLITYDVRGSREQWLSSETRHDLVGSSTDEQNLAPQFAHDARLKEWETERAQIIHGPLYVWYLVLECAVARSRKSNKQFSRPKYRFHAQGPTSRSSPCSTSPQELRFGRALRADLRLDCNMQDEGVLQKPFDRCADEERSPCMLIEVRLAHAMRKSNGLNALDIFLVLTRDSHRAENERCLRRIGLLFVRSHANGDETWLDYMNSGMAIEHGQFFLF